MNPKIANNQKIPINAFPTTANKELTNDQPINIIRISDKNMLKSGTYLQRKFVISEVI